MITALRPPKIRARRASCPMCGGAFLEHMRHHMDSLEDVIAALAAADFKGAGKVAREQLVPRFGAGFFPVEFRGMGLGMHARRSSRMSARWTSGASCTSLRGGRS